MALRGQVTSCLGELFFPFLFRLLIAQCLKQPAQFTFVRELLLQPVEQLQAAIMVSCSKQTSGFGKSLLFALLGFCLPCGLKQPWRIRITREAFFQLGEEGDAICKALRGKQASRLL